MSRRKKRFWADEEKREICAQLTTPGMSVAQVARRYAVNANLIFKWLKDPRFAPDADASEQESMFLPVEIDADAVHEPAPIDMPMPPLSAPPSICPSLSLPLCRLAGLISPCRMGGAF